MTGIKGRSFRGKIRDSATSKNSELEFLTFQPVGPSQIGLDVVSYGAFTVGASARVVEAGSTDRSIKLTDHGARRGDFIRWVSVAGADINELEVRIKEITDANNFVLEGSLSGTPAAGDTFDILRHITPRMDSSGGLSTSSIEFLLDGANVTVNEDTGTPANNRPLPVKLMDLTGDISITANNLNVQMTHAGANPDSIQIGDGTETLAINALNEAQVSDDTARTSLSSIDGKLPATLGQKAQSASLSISLSTEDDATLTAIKTAVEIIDNAISGSQMQVDLVDIADVATQTTLALMSAKLPASLGQKAQATSMSISLSTEDDVTLTAIKTAVEIIDNAVSGSEMQVDLVDIAGVATEVTLASLEGKDFSTETTLAAMSAKLPASLGAKVGASSISVVQASDTPLDIANLDVLGFVVHNFAEASSDVTDIAFRELVADIGGVAIKALQFFVNQSEPIKLATGAAVAEVERMVIGPGDDRIIDISIAANARLSMKAVNASTTINTGQLIVNYLG